MASWQNNPLFRKASAAAIAAARGAFKQTTVGKLVTEVEKLARPRNLAQAGARTEFDAILRDFAKRGMIPGLDARKLAKFGDNVQRYALEDAALEALFKALGPFGGIMRALFKAKGRGGSSRDSDVEAAVKFLQSQGFAVFRPSRPNANMIDLAARILREAGWQVISPDSKRQRVATSRSRRRPRVETIPTNESIGIAKPGPTNRAPRTGDIPPGTPEKDVKGFLVRVESSNVWAYGYDPANQILYVQFKADTIREGALHGVRHGRTKKGRKRITAKGGTLGSTIIGKSNSPGALYLYRNVTEAEFWKLKTAQSKGRFVWDVLRQRGTLHGHKKDYALVSGGLAQVVNNAGKKVGNLYYVPRKQVTDNMLVRRQLMVNGRLRQSLLQDQSDYQPRGGWGR